MGHQTVTTTMRYAYLAPCHLREAVQRRSGRRRHEPGTGDGSPESQQTHAPPTAPYPRLARFFAATDVRKSRAAERLATAKWEMSLEP